MSNKLKKRLKKTALWTVIVILALLICIHFFLGFAVKSGVQSYMPLLTGTNVKMGSFYLNTLTGKLTIKDLVIGNPEGYKTEYAFKLGKVVVNIDMTTVFSKKLVIEEILVDKAHLIYELGLGESNIGKIQENINKFTEGGKKVDKSAETKPPQAKRGESRKIQIDDFQFNNAEVSMSAVILQGGKATLPLPSIHLTGIGKEEEGTSWNQAISEMFSAVYKSMMEAVSSTGNVIKEAGKSTWEAIKEGGKGAADSVKDVFK